MLCWRCCFLFFLRTGLELQGKHISILFVRMWFLRETWDNFIVQYILDLFSRLIPCRPIMQLYCLMLFWKVCGAPAEQQLASNFIRMDRDSYMPDLIAASDCMLGIYLDYVLNEVLIYIQMVNGLSNINFLRVMSRELWLLLAQLCEGLVKCYCLPFIPFLMWIVERSKCADL